MRRDEQVEQAKAAWRRWCATMESVGLDALENSLTEDEIDLAEGLRHLGRMSRMCLSAGLENTDPVHPFLERRLGPTLKMGGDNPCGHYLSAPINGEDSFRLSGTSGSAAWVSVQAMRSYAARAAGLSTFGGGLFNDLGADADGRFEILLSPDPPSDAAASRWIQTDPHCQELAIRQFFADWGDVRPMDVRIENLTRGGEPLPLLGLDAAMAGLDDAGRRMSALTPAFQAELARKGNALNSFAVDTNDPTKTMGGVPGGSAVTLRWKLAPDEALLIEVVPPTPCAYWDVQIGNLWYESFDYRRRFSGICDAQAARNPDGSATLVVSEQDPGVRNWLETAGHRQGHLAVRWQLTDGQLPLPRTRVVKAAEVARLTALPAVEPARRDQDRAAMREAVERRFRP
jgi:hypothetical protein